MAMWPLPALVAPGLGAAPCAGHRATPGAGLRHRVASGAYIASGQHGTAASLE